MSKLFLTLSFLISFIFLSSQTLALPNCPSSPPFDNCYGSHTFASGNTYVGEWQNNKYNGEGVFTFANGNKYVGEFKNGKYNGQGTYYFLANNVNKGDVYTGEFKDNNKHGQGAYIFAKGGKYVGEYKNGKRHGQGTYYFLADNVHKGDVYIGEYKNGNRHGQGVYTFANGDKYVGEFKNAKFNGKGTFYYLADNVNKGDAYIGEFKNGKRHGQGTFTYADGSKDIGKFENDYLNGFAIRYDKYGNILKEGIWKDDKFLYTQKKPIYNSNSKLDKYKSFCSEIGFTPGTEKFGDCVLEAMKKG